MHLERSTRSPKSHPDVIKQKPNERRQCGQDSSPGTESHQTSRGAYLEAMCHLEQARAFGPLAAVAGFLGNPLGLSLFLDGASVRSECAGSFNQERFVASDATALSVMRSGETRIQSFL